MKHKISSERTDSESSLGKILRDNNKQQLEKDILKNYENKILDSLKTLNHETEQILIDIYNNRLCEKDCRTDISKYERHINSLVKRHGNNSYIHYLLEVLTEKIHERIKVRLIL